MIVAKEGTVNALLFLIFAVIGPAATLGVIWAVMTRNSFVRRINLVAESWRQIDVELRRRYDLIPNLVRVVEAYAQYERSALESLTARRAEAMAAHQMARRADAEDQLDVAVRGVLVYAERYPQLMASHQFLALQRELVNTEDRIAAGRRFYNGNVRALNTALHTFPSSIIGSSMNLGEAEYFLAEIPGQPGLIQLPPVV